MSPPSALGTSLLLPRPWAALLRLLLQQKVPAQTLKKLAGPVIMGEEEGLEEVIWACLPKITRDIWQQTPHRMYSAEAEVRCLFPLTLKTLRHMSYSRFFSIGVWMASHPMEPPGHLASDISELSLLKPTCTPDAW